MGIGLDSIGSIIGGGLNYLGSVQQNNTARDIADKQMNFQKQMSDTAHQREVEDLKKAGLNPILSAGGSGASTASGASYQPVNTLSSMVSGALEMKRLLTDVKEAKSRVELNNTKTDTELFNQQLIKEQGKQIKANTAKTIVDMFSDKNRVDIEKKNPKLWGTIDTIMNRFGELINSGARSAAMLAK